EVVTPAAEIKYSETNLSLLGRAGGGRLNSGYWFKEEGSSGGNRIINIAELKANGGVSGVTVYEFRRDQELARLSRAQDGHFDDGLLVLTDVTETHIEDNALMALADAQAPAAPLTRMQRVESRELATTLTSERLIARILTPERMSISVLLDYIDYLEDNNLQTERQVVALWRKIAYPFTLLVMITIAAPVGFMQTRR